MMSKVLIDTNIFIYAMDNSSAYHEAATGLLTNNHHTLFTTAKNISEFFAVTSKLKINLADCLAFYHEIRINCHILFPSEKSLQIFKELLEKYQPTGNKVFDVEIISIMMAHKINHIATFNQKDFITVKEI